MREIEISVSRTFPKDTLKDEWKKKSPDGTFNAGPVVREVPSDIQEAIAKNGAIVVYTDYMKQVRLNLQNELADDIAEKVQDPAKVSKRGGKAVNVPLD